MSLLRSALRFLARYLQPIIVLAVLLSGPLIILLMK